jgi:hypothetical protein
MHRIVCDDCEVAACGLQSKQSVPDTVSNAIHPSSPEPGLARNPRVSRITKDSMTIGGVGSGKSLPRSRKCSFAHLQSSR